MKLVATLLLMCGSLVCLGQQTNSPTSFKHKVHGVIQDTNGHRIPGVRMVMNGDRVALDITDINGEFAADLDVGDHVLTLQPEALYPLRAFLKIVANGPNVDNVVFTVDPSMACCVSSDGKAYPKPISFPRPAFPPVARAVRATGEVIVVVKIGPDGKVESADTQSGHPLLRKAAEVAARAAMFDPAETAVRVSQLIYVFLGPENVRDDALTLYTNPYRLYVIPPADTLNFTRSPQKPIRSRN